MEIKKTPKASLENNQTLGILMGMVVGLAILFVGFEWGTREFEVIRVEGIADILAEEEIDITIQDNTPPPPPPPPPPAVIELVELNVVEDDVVVADIEIKSSEDSQSDPQQAYVPPAPELEDEEESAQHIFTVVEKAPSFPGGDTEMMKFVNGAIRYPVIAQENGIQGRVICSFVINSDGSVVDITVVRGVDPSLDREAVRVLGTMPRWSPGEQRGKPVRVKYVMPIHFRLQ
jgi:TonB family C-terminal domain